MPVFDLFEDTHCAALYPFHLVAGVQSIRHGAWTQQERWDAMAVEMAHLSDSEAWQINARWIPDEDTSSWLQSMPTDGSLWFGKTLLATRTGPNNGTPSAKAQAPRRPDLLVHANDLFHLLEQRLSSDFAMLRTSSELATWSPTDGTSIYGDSSDFLVSKSATVRAASVDTSSGPVIIQEGATVEPGAHLIGPLLIQQHAVVKAGAIIKGPTVLGPFCKVGGEVSNVHFQGWANKAHDGFLGNSVIGRWCNLGAGTSASNLKNNYGPVRQWSHATQSMVDSGLQFCGLLMGDHSKCGIGTHFNTGTIVGPASMVFDLGFPPKHIPPFSWLNARTGERHTHDLLRMKTTADAVMARRGCQMEDPEWVNLSALHDKARERHEDV